MDEDGSESLKLKERCLEDRYPEPHLENQGGVRMTLRNAGMYL